MSTQDANASGIVAAITDASDDSIIVISLDGTILMWGSGATRLYGYTEDEVRIAPSPFSFPKAIGVSSARFFNGFAQVSDSENHSLSLAPRVGRFSNCH